MNGPLPTLASFLLPFIAGRLLVGAVWPSAPRLAAWAVGPLAGIGLAGCSFFLGIVLFGSGSNAIVVSESILALTIVLLGSVLGVSKRRARRASASPDLREGETKERTAWNHVPGWNRVGGATLLVCLLLASLGFLFSSSVGSHGGWDAIAIWNMKARFIERGGADALERITSTWISDTQPDYPLLLPSLIARGWAYAGEETSMVPRTLALAFLALTIATVVSLVGAVSGPPRAYAAGAVLAGTPFLVQHAASLYADVPIAAFTTAAVLLWAVRDNDGADRSSGVVVLAGMMAGFAATTKNEGMLFVLVLFAVRGTLLFWRGDWRVGLIDMRRATIALVLATLALTAFKVVVAPENPIAAGMTGAAMLGRLASFPLHATVIGGWWSSLSQFGLWWVTPLPLLVAHGALEAAASRSGAAPGRPSEAWWTPALVLAGMTAGFYLVYLFSPYDVAWHIESSLSRLALQLWPMTIALATMAGARAERPVGPIRLSRTRGTAIIVTAGFVALLVAARLSFASIGAPPTLELSTSAIVAGSGNYTLRLRGLEDQIVEVGYRLDDGDEEFMRITLDETGEITFDVSADTPRGTYVFTSVRVVNTGESHPVTGQITVR